MNSCVLMAEVIQDPQLRYTPDTQTPIAEMAVQFPGLRAEDPPSTLKVVGWGNLAQEIQERYHQGDRLLIEGRLRMSTVDRPDGLREKRAELTAQRIHPVTMTAPLGAPAASPVPTQTSSVPSSGTGGQQPPATPASPPQPAPEVPDYDDIPF